MRNASQCLPLANRNIGRRWLQDEINSDLQRLTFEKTHGSWTSAFVKCTIGELNRTRVLRILAKPLRSDLISDVPSSVLDDMSLIDIL